MKNKDLTIGSPYKNILFYCIPLMLSVIFQQFYNLADSFIAGKFISENALAAVGNSYEITLIFLAFATGCNIGASVIVSTFFGAKNNKGIKEAVSTALITSLIICIILVILGYSLQHQILKLINTPDNIYEDSKNYLDIYIASLPFIFLYNIATGIFSALGDSKTPFVFLLASSIANIGLNLLFVLVFDLGVIGLALATLICQGIASLLSLIVVFKKISIFRCEEKYKLFSIDILKSFLYVAIPSILQQSFISIGNIIIQSEINYYGSGVIAGYAASVKVHNLIITALTALGNGVSNYTSQNIGANKIENITKGMPSGYLVSLTLAVPSFIVYFFFSEQIINLFIDNPSLEALDSGVKFLKTVSPFYFVCGLKLVSDGILRGSRMMNEFMIGTFLDLLLRTILAIVFSRCFGYNAIWYSFAIGWSVSAVVSLSFMIHKYGIKGMFNELF